MCSYYEKLGALDLGETRIPQLSAETIDVPALREAVLKQVQIPFEELSSADRSRHADEIIRSGWKLATYPALRT